jgi:imidazolonepropionase-like amidohydrolase
MNYSLKKSLVILLLLAVAIPSFAQSRLEIWRGTTIHVGDGKTLIQNGFVSFYQGKIVAVGSCDTLKIPENAVVKTFIGKHIYPALIACNTNIGLQEIELARPTRDEQEVGELNPNVRALIAYNTDSRIGPTLRTNGVLMVQTVPDGGLVTGQSSIFKLDAWNWEDAAYRMDDGLHIHWPSMELPRLPEGSNEDPNKGWTEALNTLNKLFEDAKVYGQNPYPVNLKLAAMQKALKREQKVYIHLHTAKEILAAFEFIAKYNLDAVLVDAEEAYLLANQLEAKKIPVIIGTTHALPNRTDDDIQQPYKTPAQLYKAGVLVAIQHKNWSGNQRNLPFAAGTAAAYGLLPEQALQCITLNAASVLGIADRTGSISVGKDANLIVSEGDVLDMKSSIIVDACLVGMPVQLRNSQTELYEKYLKHYEELGVPKH